MPKEIGHMRVKILNAPLRKLNNRKEVERRLVGILDRQDLSKVSLPALESSLPFHPAILLTSLSTTGWMSSLLSLVKWRGTPKYFTGKEPMAQQNNLEKLLLSSYVMPKVRRSHLS